MACGGGGPEAKAPGTSPVAASAHVSTTHDREQIAITVYNSNFGLVREVRNIAIPRGRVSLEFRDVAQYMQPETVHIKSLSAPTALTVLEQNYRYDLLTPQKLLEKYVGKKIRIHRWNQKEAKEEDVEAEVLSANSPPIFRIGGEVTYGFPGRLGFSEVPANLIPKPTLVWLLDSDAPRQRVEVAYLTAGLNWQSDYVLTVDENDKLGDLAGWVTLTNHSGTAYDNAQLKLVAGNVQRVAPASGVVNVEEITLRGDIEQKKEFREEGLFEYHLYTLERPTTLLENEQKQVTLLEAHGVRLDKKLIFYGEPYMYRGQYGEIEGNHKVGVYFDIENKEANQLGMPLPKGTVRVYKADKSGAKQFVGEDTIDHTPRDEKVRIKMGDAFDVVGDRKQMSWSALGDCVSESDWEISIRNHKSEAVTVEDFEPVEGEWVVLSSSLPAKRRDSQTFTFDVTVPARGEVKVAYRVRVKWC